MTLLPSLAAAVWVTASIVGAVIAGVVVLCILLTQKKASRAEAAGDAARDAGLSVETQERSDELPAGLDGVAILNAGRARRVTAVAHGERGIHAFTTFGLIDQVGGRHTPTTRRLIAVHQPRSGTDPLHAVSLPAGAPEGLLDGFGYQSVDAPRTVRANDAAEAAAWASQPALVDAAGEDAMLETGPAGLTFLAPGDASDAKELEHAIERALHAAG
ncbi:hypothetical protein [Phycisphaera mikurensis]|uniref:Uncharacterized protein n=1 Tax=Phycisphaera mikurensis (strain NBRC 102666 / KCTC 22515 / FYK2301M01) TaxID=1142394 RepID=I0IE49_PHYMF|nr:hypothetical protein [Phycisphaera mikurensis]MBB6441342.1 hypothetical protein [Phycisphaera mikurensis]BAM03537.1 hypothetical protein PSMK_13780 [Phycisphaera mikurensis NBRC 102666]